MAPTLDRLFGEYAIQTAIMRDLNFYDYRNLQLAGCRIPVTSGAVRKKYLVPIHCDELGDDGSRCGKSPPTVEMKACQGLSVVLRPEEEDPRLASVEDGHLHDDGGEDKSKCFWVCNECRDRSQEQYGNHGDLMAPSYVPLCKIHSLKHERFPSDACHCSNATTGDWRCSICIRTSLDVMGSRAHNACQAAQAMPLHVTLLGIWTVIVHPPIERTPRLLWKLQQAQNILNNFLPSRFLSNVNLQPRTLRLVKWSKLCPIENCRRARWKNERVRRICLECKAVFPARNATL